LVSAGCTPMQWRVCEVSRRLQKLNLASRPVIATLCPRARSGAARSADTRTPLTTEVASST
jgi:hypothetical protein